LSRSKNGSDEKEYYKGEIRRLKKQLKQYQKRESLLDERLDGDSDEPIITNKEENSCPNCEDGEIKILDLGIKVIEICSDCGYKKIVEEKK